MAEIVAYNQDNQKFYLVNGREKKLDIVSLAGLTAGQEGQTLSLETRVDVSGMIPGFTFGDLTSVAVDTAHDRIAVAVQAEDYAANGAILLLNYAGEYLAHYTAGVQPDNVVFSPRRPVCPLRQRGGTPPGLRKRHRSPGLRDHRGPGGGRPPPPTPSPSRPGTASGRPWWPTTSC